MGRLYGWVLECIIASFKSASMCHPILRGIFYRVGSTAYQDFSFHMFHTSARGIGFWVDTVAGIFTMLMQIRVMLTTMSPGTLRRISVAGMRLTNYSLTVLFRVCGQHLRNWFSSREGPGGRGREAGAGTTPPC